MDEKIIDWFMFNLAQENYEECYRLIGIASFDTIIDKGFKVLVCFDMLYYEFAQVTHNDLNRENAMHELAKEIHEFLNPESDPIFNEILTIVEIKLKAASMYKLVSQLTFEVPEEIEHSIYEFLNELGGLYNEFIAPVKEALELELLTLQHLLQAKKNLSKFEYMSTIIYLTQAHSYITQWAKIFIFKKYSPYDKKNSKAEYNFLYKFLLKVLHGQIAKASLYFEKTLSVVNSWNFLQFGTEYITREVVSSCSIKEKSINLGINYIALLLHTEDLEAFNNLQKEGYFFSRTEFVCQPPTEKFTTVCKFGSKTEELSEEAEVEMKHCLEIEMEVFEVPEPQALKIVHNGYDTCFLFFKVDSSVYLCCMYAGASIRREAEKKEISKFFNELSIQLKMLSTIAYEREK